VPEEPPRERGWPDCRPHPEIVQALVEVAEAWKPEEPSAETPRDEFPNWPLPHRPEPDPDKDRASRITIDLRERARTYITPLRWQQEFAGEGAVRSSEVAAKSLKASFKETVDWASRKTLESVGDMAHPGLGKLINLAFVIHECSEDLAALDNPHAPRTLGVPLAESCGIGISLQVAVPCRDRADDSGPRVLAVIAPNGNSPLGGWNLETVDEDDHAGHESAGTPVPVWQIENRQPDIRSLRVRELVPDTSDPVPGPPDNPVPSPTQRPARAAVAAAKFASLPLLGDYEKIAGLLLWLARRRRKWLDPGAAGLPDLMLLIDPRAGIGVWVRLVQQRSFSQVAWRIEIAFDPATGEMTVLVVEG
jgi:hypothetical protein